MNYQKIYDQICQRAKDELEIRKQNKKTKKEYYEGHHIIPQCMKGEGDSIDWDHPNIAPLTAREHFICHWLLYTIHPNNLKIQFAFEMMCFAKNNKQTRYTPSSRIIERARKTIIERNKEIGKLKIGKKYPKLSEAKIGFKFSKESIANMSIAQINMSKEKRENINASQKNLRWITDGIIDRRYPKNKDIPIGYINGRSFKLKKSSIEKQKQTKKLRVSNKGASNPSAKSILQYDMKGNLLKEYSTIKQAELETGISKIGCRCSGKIKQHEHFIFKYK